MSYWERWGYELFLGVLTLLAVMWLYAVLHFIVKYW